MIIYLDLMLPLDSSCLPNLALHQAGVYQPDCLQSVGRELLPHDFNLTVPDKSELRRCIFCCTFPRLHNKTEGLRTSVFLLRSAPVRSCHCKGVRTFLPATRERRGDHLVYLDLNTIAYIKLFVNFSVMVQYLGIT